jgi:hypothetical protein
MTKPDTSGRVQFLKVVDAFAVFMIEESFFGAFLTLIGVIGVGVYMGFLVDRWIASPTVTVASVEPTSGQGDQHAYYLLIL